MKFKNFISVLYRENTYRSEIDGLRALAVLPVILFHAGLDWVPGGYVGVDVFFVISGFLITGILMRELEAGSFSVLTFYERRARRILPALFSVMAVTAGLGILFMLPYELRELAQSMIAVLSFVSNVFFWLEVNYFSTSAERLPLLHTWSLSVEEQFYIFFPLALWLFWRFWRGGLIPAMFVVFLGSLLLAQLLVQRAPSPAFYLLPTRAWELLAGSLSAVYLLRSAQPGHVAGEILGAAGLLSILYSILFFHEGTPFPSLWTLVPVLGTVGVLIGASEHTFVGRFLSLKPAVFIGLISYSAYLWHQPLFAFARISAPDHHPSGHLMIGLAALSLVLAWVSWRFIEQPFRRKDGFTRRQIFVHSGFGAAVLAGVASAFLFTQGLVQRFPEDQQAWLVRSPAEYGAYVSGAYAKIENAPLSEARPNLVLVGDSFSQDFYNMVAENEAFPDHAISAIYIPARCQLSFGFSWDETRALIQQKDREMCSRKRVTSTQQAIIQNADIVVFAFSWREWSAERMADVLRNLELREAQDVFVIGSKRFLSRRQTLQIGEPSDIRVAPSARVAGTTRILSATLPKDVFVDTLAIACQGGCPLFTPDGALISHDGSHLTREGARYIGDALMSTSPLADYGS